MAAPSDNVYIKDLPGDVNEEMLQTVFVKCNIVSMRAFPTKFEGGNGAALIRFATVEEASWIVENLNGNIPEGLEQAVVVQFAHDNKGKGKDGGGAADWGKADAGKGAGWGKVSLPGKGGKHAGPYDAAYGKAAPKGKGGGGKTGKPGHALDALINNLSETMMLPGGKGQMPLENQLYVTGLPTNTTDTDLYRIFSPFGAIPTKGVWAMIDKTDGVSCTGIGFVDFIEPISAELALVAISGTTMPDGVTVQITSKKPGKGKGKGEAIEEFA